MQRSGVKPELEFLLLLDEVLLEFYLNFDPLVVLLEFYLNFDPLVDI